MAVRTCTVSFMDRGKRESLEVWAASTYEAAVLAIKAFEKVRSIRGPSRHTVLEVEVKQTRQFKVKVGDVLDWLYDQPARSPTERAQKQKLKTIMASDDRRG